MHFLVPSSPFDIKKPDEAFRDQVHSLKAHGFGVTLFSFEELQAGSFRTHRPIPHGATVVYRGWMVTPSEYEKILALVRTRSGVPYTTLEEYLSCHHLPSWYPVLSDVTAETRVFPADADLEAELRQLGWSVFFIKDHVKSLKTSVGSVVSDPSQIAGLISEMRKFRGVIEGGICVRRFEKLIPGSERRYFVLQGAPHGAEGSVPPIVADVARRIRSPFYSVDIAVREDGVLRVVEVGDGQVSDLVGWTPESFAALWHRRK